MPRPPFEEGDSKGSVDAKKPYAKPVILHELELETRAGSPIPPTPFAPFLPPGARP